VTTPRRPGRPRQEPIAIIGISALMPGSSEMGGFWRTVVEGRDLVTDVPRSHWLVSDYYDPDPAAPDKAYAHRGSFLDPVDFDPFAFGMPPSALPATDTSQTLTLVAARHLLDDVARCAPRGFDPERVSVILGAGPLELLTTMANRLQRPVWVKAMREAGLPEPQVDDICDRIAAHYVPWQEATLPGLLSNVVAGRVANRFDVHGSNYITDAACAGSLAALSSAINELSLRQADMVVTGGVDTLNDIVWYSSFSKTPALSPTGDCRPFSADSDGMVLGEGVVLFALKRLADAERDGDAVYAVIRGLGTSSDGRGTAVYAPLPEGQVRSLRRAYDAAGYSPATVELMEAHGTGTPAGDAAEVAALREVFGEAAPSPTAWCALGSIKSQFGHTKSTAGAAGLLKAVLALHHKVLPPTIKVARPNPRLGLADSPFHINTITRPWIRNSAHARRASVSSFGFGGTNFHVTAEEYTPRNGGRCPHRLNTAPAELVTPAADSLDGFLHKCRAMMTDERPLSLIARETQRELDASQDDLRLAVVAASADEMRRKVEQAAARIHADPRSWFSTPDGVHYGAGRPADQRVAFLFPGQGSQYVGMGADLAMHVPEVRQVWDRLADVQLGEPSLHRVVFPPPAFSDAERNGQVALLTATEWAQPAVAAHSMAMLPLLRTFGLRPSCAAGHSLGELTALHAAGAIDAEALLRLTRRRGELVRDAAREPGGMLAIQAPAEDVDRAIRAVGLADLWPANHNSPDQTVAAGSSRSIAILHRYLEGQGVRVRSLAVSTAFHSPLIEDAAGPLLDHVRGLSFARLEFAIYGNRDAAPYAADASDVAQRLVEQLVSPVLFADQIAAIYNSGIRTFVEVGPGSTLTGLVRANLRGREHTAVSLDRPGKNGLVALYDGLGALVARGVPLNLAPLWRDVASSASPEPPRSPATVQISGTNFGKAYPPAGGVKDLPPPNPEPVVGSWPGLCALNSSEGMTAMPQQGDQPNEQSPAQQQPVAQPVLADGGADWLQTVREIHRLAAETHASYQRSMADAQLAYLTAVDRSLSNGQGGSAPSPHGRPVVASNLDASLGDVAGDVRTGNGAGADGSGEPRPTGGMAAAVPMEPPPLAPPPDIFTTATFTPEMSTPETFTVEPDWPEPAEPTAAWSPHDQAAAVQNGWEPPTEPRPDVAPGSASHAEAPAVPPAPVTESPAGGSGPDRPDGLDRAGSAVADLTALTLQIVADKTGYPAEILRPEMHLQADLGIDSIKRVEVLSALRDHIEGLPTLDAAELGRLQTIGEIADRLVSEVGR
jgi:polyketide-type polyunsaturated fatty acid synthase PfaA